MEVKLETEGLKEFVAALKRFPGKMKQEGETGMGLAMEEFKDEAATYPPATEANRPRSYMTSAGWDNWWYERGYGSRWARADGTVGGSPTSETLGRSWGVDVRVAARTIRGTLTARASYAADVKGDQQKSYHQAHGWTTLRQDFEKRQSKIVAILEAAFRRALDWVAGQA